MRETVPQALKDFFAAHPRLALAFSGGVDSAYLLYAASACGCDVAAYCVKSPFQPGFELDDARRLAESLGAEMRVIEADALADADVRANPANRCYYCKRFIFTSLLDRAHAGGYDTVIDGTNASDDAGDRPGMKALRELNVLSPLRLCGVTKAQIREYSRRAGLITWDKPAYACLATRVPAGEPITLDKLRRVEGAEAALFRLGFNDFRVRLFHDAARLQFPAAQIEPAARRRVEIRDALKPYFDVIMIDTSDRG